MSFIFSYSLARSITEDNINIVPNIICIVRDSPNKIMPIIMLTIGSKVPRMEVEEDPIIFKALINNTMDMIVETNEIPTMEEIETKLKLKEKLPIASVKKIRAVPAESEK